MQLETSGRGFRFVTEEKYQMKPGEYTKLIQESSAIGSYEDSMDIPGSSYLFVGKDHHLNREQVKELIGYMQHWLDNKQLFIKGAK